jgi:hypothetical protein
MNLSLALSPLCTALAKYGYNSFMFSAVKRCIDERVFQIYRYRYSYDAILDPESDFPMNADPDPDPEIQKLLCYRDR